MILGVGDPEYVQTMEDLMGAFMELFQMAMALGEDRLQNPTDDITSILMHAEVDGERLTGRRSSRRSSSCSSSPATRRPATRSATA